MCVCFFVSNCKQIDGWVLDKHNIFYVGRLENRSLNTTSDSAKNRIYKCKSIQPYIFSSQV